MRKSGTFTCFLLLLAVAVLSPARAEVRYPDVVPGAESSGGT